MLVVDNAKKSQPKKVNVSLGMKINRNKELDWVECTACEKWRVWGSNEKIPLGDWQCSSNTWDSFNSCDVPEQDY